MPRTSGEGAPVPGGTGFVGRRRERRDLREQLTAATGGQPRFALVQGPAGIGKSSLLECFLGDAREAGTVSVVVGADEQEAGLPFELASRLTTRLQGRAAEPPAGQADPTQIGAGLLAALGASQDAGPLVVAVEDAQWADRPSLDALAFALRRLENDRVLCLVTARDDAPLPEGLTRLAGAQRGRRLQLRGMEADELAELAAAVGAGELPRAAAERLREHTAGNPLHARAVLEELELSVLTRTRGPLPAPRSFRMLMLSRLAACSPDAEQLVSAAAVCGLRCSLRLAAEVAGIGGALPAVDEAVRAGFVGLNDTDADRVLVFTHPLIRAAVYHDLGPARRAKLHGRAAERTSGRVALDHRVAATPTTDPQLSAELEEQAAREAEAGAAALAGEHLAAAARLAEDAARRERLLLAALEVLLRGGRVAEARRLAEDVRTLPPSQRWSLLLGRVAMLAGDHEQAERELMRALEAREPPTSGAVAAQAALHLGDLRLIEARPREAVNWARRALEGPLEPGAAASARRVLALGLGMSGRQAEISELHEDEDRVPGDGLEAYEPLLARGIVRLWTGDLPGAHGDLSVIASAGEAPCPLRVRLGGLACLAKTCYHLGDWQGAIAAATTAVDLATDGGHDWALAFLHATAALVPAARGQWEIADTHAARSEHAGRRSGHATDLAYAAHARAQLAFARGDPAGVVSAVEPVLHLAGEGRIEEPGAMRWYELYADALVSLQRLDEAEEAVGVLEVDRSPRSRPLRAGHVARIRGRLASARGDRQAAGEAFERAWALLEEHPAVLERALLQDDYGRFLRRTGKRARAAEHLRAAAETYRRLDAAPLLEAVGPELQACGLDPAARGPGPTAELTPQELAVSRLVATGMTNREVAAELVLSVKTIEYHLGNVYRKLGVSSRTQLTARLAGGDGLPSAG